MNISERYVLETDGILEVNIGVCDDGCGNIFITMQDTWEGMSIIGGLDNSAIDAIMSMLDKARVQLNS